MDEIEPQQPDAQHPASQHRESQHPESQHLEAHQPEPLHPEAQHLAGDADTSRSGLLAFDGAERGLVSAYVDAVAGTRRSVSMLAAAEATALTQLVTVAQSRADRRRVEGRSGDLPMRELTAEVAAALRVSDRVAQRMLSEALVLTTAFPATHEALADGRISPSHERVIVDAGAAIADDDARAEYERTVLRIAEVESAGRLRSMAQIVAARANPEGIDDRHRRARRDRNIRVLDGDDAMAELRAWLPAALAYGIYDRLTQQAHTVQDDEIAAARAAAAGDGVLSGLDVGDLAAAAGEGAMPGVDTATRAAVIKDGVLPGLEPGDVAAVAAPAPMPDAETDPPRSIDELRADLFCDLLLSGAPTGHGDGLQHLRGYVQVTVPVLTLAGESDEPAVLAGHGPIDADTARCLAATATGWDRVLTSPFTGEVLGVDRYTPSEQLQRWLRVRDQHCRFPGCRMPFWRDDVDHTIDAAHGGPTRHDNLANVCRNHHVLKHQTDWRVRQLHGGRLEWTSPGGRTYIDTPERTLLFTPDGDPPPF